MSGPIREPLPVSAHSGHGEPVDASETVHHREPPDSSGPTPTYWLVVSRASDAVVVSLHGALDLPATVRLRAILTDLIVGQSNLAVTVDLRDLGLVDAASVDVFVAAAIVVEQRGGTLALCGPPEQITGALRSLGLVRLISGNPSHRGRLPARVATSREHHPAGNARGLLAPQASA